MKWDNSFWKKSSAWPRDWPGQVFFARAFDRIGRSMYDLEWRGIETSVVIPDPIPDVLVSSSPSYRAHVATAKNLLGDRNGSGDLSLEDWRKARRIEQEKHANYRPYVQRREAVISVILKGCESGTLAATYRAKVGGEHAPVPVTWWNTERNDLRFRECQINPKDPFTNAVGGDAFCWLYLTSESLDQYLTSEPQQEQHVGIDVHLSPYMVLMLNIARKMQISPENQPKHSEIEAMIKAAWGSLPNPGSDRLPKAMATLLRETGSQEGRAATNKTNNKNRKG